MGKFETYAEKTETLIAPFLLKEKLELVDTEFLKEGSDFYLRIYIDKEGGVTIDDCEKVSRYLNPKLDEEDYIDETYILEVSSPGLGRAIKKEKDFNRNIDREIEVHLFKPVEKEKAFVGILKSFTKDEIVIEASGKDIPIERKNISKLTEYVDFGA